MQLWICQKHFKSSCIWLLQILYWLIFMLKKILMLVENPIIPHTSTHDRWRPFMVAYMDTHYHLPAALQCVNTLWSAKHMSSFGLFSSFAFSSSSLLSSIFLSLFSRFSSLFSFFRRSFSYSQGRENLTDIAAGQFVIMSQHHSL